jgi:ferredoxin
MLAPDVFDQGDDGIVILLTDSVEGDSQNIVDSIRVCPSAAINLVD